MAYCHGPSVDLHLIISGYYSDSNDTSTRSQFSFDDHSYIPPTSSDSRGPCPALNTLANHGFLARSGQEITEEQVTEAIASTYRLSHVLASALSKAWEQVGYKREDGKYVLRKLEDLGAHNVVEHDVSMTRLDAYHGNQICINEERLQDLLNHSLDGQHYTSTDFANLHNRRYENSKNTNPEVVYGLKQALTSYGEMALLLRVFGDGDKVKLDDLRQVLGNEQLPSDYRSDREKVHVLAVAKTIIDLKARAGVF